MNTIKEITDLDFNNYINYLIENEGFVSDMYDYILAKGESNILKLGYLLSDVDAMLFCRKFDFIEEERENVDKQIKRFEEKGYDLPLVEKRTLEERLEYVKSVPGFEKCTEEQKEKRLKFVTENYRDTKEIDIEKLAGYDWKFHNVRKFRELIFDEIERLEKNGKEEKKKDGEFTEARQVLAITTLLGYLNVNENNADKTQIAKFIQFLTGRETGCNRIQDTNIYKKHLSGGGKTDKKYNEDCLFVAEYFRNLGLTELAEKLTLKK